MTSLLHRLRSPAVPTALDLAGVALLATLVAPLYLNLLVLDRDLSPDHCDRSVRVALTAARANLLG